jgi:hypothetical protein
LRQDSEHRLGGVYQEGPPHRLSTQPINWRFAFIDRAQ